MAQPSARLAPDGLYQAPELTRRAQLRQELRGFQIFFIILSGVIGTSVFNTAGQALSVAGPMGLLLAILFAGLVAVCVGETVSEMVQVFPVPNAIFEYIAAWVDEDLAWVMGIVYWIAWAMTFPEMMLSAAQLSTYWKPEPVWPPLIFYFFVPCVLVVVNLFPVYVYGWIETVGGLLKAVLVFSITCILYNISRERGATGVQGFISDLFQNDTAFASTPLRAFCYVVPVIMLGFMGVESTTVAAYEARSRRDIGMPALWLHWIIYLLYFLCTMGIVVTVGWRDPRLPSAFGGNFIEARSTLEPINNTTLTNCTIYCTSSPTILAIYGVNPNLAGVANGCLIFSVVSAANSALYYASRTLYGFTYNLPETHSLSRNLRGLSLLMGSSGAPGRAIFLTFIAFCWIPYLQLIKSVGIDNVLEIMSLTSSLSLLIVWVALLVAFLRYKAWTVICADRLDQAGYGHYVRDSSGYRQMARNYLLTIQPAIAWVGILGCVLIFIFASAMWWDTPATVAEVFTAYGAHMVAVILLVGIKVGRGRWRRWGVPLNPNGVELLRRIKRLEFLSDKKFKNERRSMEHMLDDNTSRTGPVNHHTYASPTSGPMAIGLQ